MSLVGVVGSTLVRPIASVVRARYRVSAREVGQIQEKTLKRNIGLISGSAYARDLGVEEGMDASSFQKLIRLSQYDDVAPYVQRLADGEQEALFHRRAKVEMLTLSSGTTAEKKTIPVTRTMIADLRRSWWDWGCLFYDQNPVLIDCPITQVVSDWDQYRTLGDLPVGDISGKLADIQPWYVSRFYTLPRGVEKITNQIEKYQFLMRLLMADHRVRFITTATPATLLAMAQTGNRCKEGIIRAIYDGEPGISLPAQLSWLKKYCRSNRRRARWLEKISHENDELLPRNYWPQMHTLGCWTSGTMGHYQDSLTDAYGVARFYDIGYTASEGHLSIPYEGGSGKGYLNLGSLYYEFQRLPNEELVPMQELAKGELYRIVITGPNGLMRYQLGDVVRFAGTREGWPLVEFCHKGNHVSDLTGEKLTAHQAAEAVKQAQRKVGIKVGDFVIAPVKGVPPCYEILLEKEELIEKSSLDLAASVDSALMEQNFIYKEHRSAGKLRALQLRMVEKGYFAHARAEQLRRRGTSPEQYKPECLRVDVG